MEGPVSGLNSMTISKSRITLSQGGGGRATSQLIDQLFFKHFNNPLLAQRNDQAIFQPPSGRLVMSTDSHVVSPLFFPGGNIGSLAVHGTINDLVMSGARPLYLSAAFILEEGLLYADLEKIVISMAESAHQAGTPIITGDTKVVERGKADGVFITTTGIGVVADDVNISSERAKPGCAILINGSIGDHGMAIMASREHLQFASAIQSDSVALHELVAMMLQVAPGAIHCLRDPTRGGVAAVLNELATQSGVGILLDEQALPIKPDVQAVCEILGRDPLSGANEGKLIAICEANAAADILASMHQHPLGREAAIIGYVVAEPKAMVEMTTIMGGRRLVDWPWGEQLPRIC